MELMFLPMSSSFSTESFRFSLDLHYTWPAYYPFKFIVPESEKPALLELFADAPISERPSRKGRFVAMTFELYVNSADEVIALYERAAHIPEVISL